VNQKNRLIRVMPAEPIVLACEDGATFWRMLKRWRVSARGGRGIREQIRAEFAQSLAAAADGFSRQRQLLDGETPLWQRWRRLRP